jgi:hypothetical protein
MLHAADYQWKLTQQHQECVRRRAILSVRARPTCKDEAHATRVVNHTKGWRIVQGCMSCGIIGRSHQMGVYL